MLDIENSLKEDTTGNYKKELLGQFNGLSTEIRTELNKGLSPNDYEVLSRLLQAVEASISIVDKY
ncbi:MAG: EscE/YscE/SsaE family type III secretion system needle protein co-chaperone [Thiotrichaceae bacterium]|nr:EscE/YscE/SsaE family type III secretion system needle protein co-chaperone [Thiotrichaceae bacterium]